MTAGDVITFDVLFPKANFNDFRIRLLRLTTSLNILYPTPAGFDTRTSIGNMTLTWNVAETGTYYVQIIDSGSSTHGLIVVYVVATHNNGTELIRYSNVVFSSPKLYFYLETNSSVTFTRTGSTSFYTYESNVYLSRISYMGTDRNYPNLAAGYYYISPSSSSADTITYPSDPYPCPYDAAYPDLWGVFAPCLDYGTSSSSNSTNSTNSSSNSSSASNSSVS